MQGQRIAGRRFAAALIAIGGLMAFGAVAVARTAVAQPGLPSASPSTITMIGDGEARGAPDVAYITVGVQTQGATAVQASDENSRRMAAVLEALRSRGVAPEDIQTSGLSVTPQHPPISPPPSGGDTPRVAPAPGVPAPAGYQANNTVTVTVQPVERAGALLDAALAASANQLGGVRFGIKDMTALRQQAIEEATQAARAKAEQLAAKLGLRLVGISSIVEETGGVPYPLPEIAAAAPPAVGAYAPPIESGTLRVTARVRVAFQFQ